MSKQCSTAFLYLYVVITGASVMALELAASRFLAPYFGTSMIVWANIIGLILLSLSLGYWIGGRVADKRPHVRLLMTVSLVAGIWSSLLPLWGNLIFHSLTGDIMTTPVYTIVLSFIAILLVFAPPVFLLAMVSPFAIRIVSVCPEKMGKVAGNLYAFSTLGSLIGTFGTAFGTIPFWGTRETLFFWSGALILISAVGLRGSWLGRFAYICLLIPIAMYIGIHGPMKTASNVIWSKDTLYQFVQVVKEPDQSTALVYNEGGGIQSLHRPGDALNPSDYYDDYLLLPYLMPQSNHVLVLGSAGGTIPRLMSKYVKPSFPQMSITGVEIDPDVIPLDQKYFGLQPGDANLVNQDARVFVNQTRNHYDLIIVDAYTQQIYIPFHLSTVEFFHQLQNHLQPWGIVALNINAIHPTSKLLTSMEKTFHSAFPYSYVLRARGDFNYVLIGSLKPIVTDRLNQIGETSPLYSIRKEWPDTLAPITDAQIKTGTLLTDNKAPVEMLTDSMIVNFVREQP
jgi:spermidine synthase